MRSTASGEETLNETDNQPSPPDHCRSKHGLASAGFNNPGSQPNELGAVYFPLTEGIAKQTRTLIVRVIPMNAIRKNQMPMTDSSKPRTKRRWLSLSLRMFLLLITAFAIWLAWLVPRAQQQKRVADWIREFGRTPYYNYQYNPNGKYARNRKPPGPKWLRDSLGVDYFSSIRMIHLDNRPVGDISMISTLAHLRHCEMSECELTDLSPLANLRKLELLSVSHNPISDLSPVSGLKRLKHLSIFDTDITDISPVRGLSQLESLYLINNENTDLSPLKDHPSLITIDVSHSKIDNIEPLKSIATLKSVNVSGTMVPEDQIRELERALPNCTVIR